MALQNQGGFWSHSSISVLCITLISSNSIEIIVHQVFPAELGPTKQSSSSEWRTRLVFSWHSICWDQHILLPYKPLLFSIHHPRLIIGNVKSSHLVYNRCETRGKPPQGRDPDRSWCHRHISKKLFQLQPMAPQTQQQHTPRSFHLACIPLCWQ